MRVEKSYSYKTASSKLVQVAEIASRYKGRPEMLMKVIIQAQQIVPAFSEAVAAVIAREMEIPQTQVYSFITFYAMLSVKPRGKYIIRMCKSAPCHVKGAREIVRALEEMLHIRMGETTEDNRFTLEYCPCLGMCEISPAIMINDRTYGNLTVESIRNIIKKYIREDAQL
ncbi:MAG: NAD(P)H-dependent oxidoreductase subunit E [Lachnospiraceae bacterium]